MTTESNSEPETVKELLDLFRSRVTNTEQQIKKADFAEKQVLKLEAEIWRQARDATKSVYLYALERISDRSLIEGVKREQRTAHSEDSMQGQALSHEVDDLEGVPETYKWNEGPPAEPGWYFYRDDSFGRGVVCVRDERAEFFNGNDYVIYDLPGQWAGPIPEPADPE